jgi:hypothetical protein
MIFALQGFLFYLHQIFKVPMCILNWLDIIPSHIYTVYMLSHNGI